MINSVLSIENIAGKKGENAGYKTLMKGLSESQIQKFDKQNTFSQIRIPCIYT